MVAAPAFRSDERFTQREFRRWVDKRPWSDLNRYELIQGRICMTPPAGWSHGSIATTLVSLISQHVRRRKLGQVFESSVGYDLPTGDTLEPDVSFISAERFAAAPPKTPNEFLRIVPSLVVEVLSASTAKRDQTEKKDIYEANGVDEYWIVDARRKLVPVFYREEHGYGAAQFFRRGLIRSRALPRLRVSVDAVFRGP